jgi:hypothetical protein
VAQKPGRESKNQAHVQETEVHGRNIAERVKKYVEHVRNSGVRLRNGGYPDFRVLEGRGDFDR